MQSSQKALNKSYSQHQTAVQLFRKCAFSPFQYRKITDNQDQLQDVAEEIYNWARNNGADYVCFLAHPLRKQPLEVQSSFLTIRIIKQHLIQSIGSQQLKINELFCQQIDGSRIPNGGLREIQKGKTYLVWDHLSELFIKRNSATLYVPSLIISKEGNALDDKVHFRIAERKLEEQLGDLLKKFKIDHKGVFMGTKIKQTFYIVPKRFNQSRIDLQKTGRSLFGRNLDSGNQNNFMRKIPSIVNKVLKETQQELLQIGVPVKGRISQDSPNQFSLLCELQNVALSIDHNALMMQVLREVCLRNQMEVLFHQKPFESLSQSNKAINWSLYYLNMKKKPVNLLEIGNEHTDLLILLTLMTIKTVQENSKLLINSVSVPGNEVKSRQKQFFPQILSVSLGEQLGNMLQNLQKPQMKNLKNNFSILLKELIPNINEYNRSSPYAYTQTGFEFRMCGASQNITFPIVVIMSALIREISIVNEKLSKGDQLQKIINYYKEQTRKKRFQGNCYSLEWKNQAQRRKIYNPKLKFVDFIKAIKTYANCLTENAIYTKREIQARFEIMSKEYIDTVLREEKALLRIVRKVIIPKSYSFMQIFPREVHLKNIESRMRKFDRLFEAFLGKVEQLQNKTKIILDLDSAGQLRQEIFKISEAGNRLLEELPYCEDFPEVSEILDKWIAY